MKGDDERRTAVITGAASGIGAACVRRFVADGWTVGLLDTDEVGLDALAVTLPPGSVHTVRCDVSDIASTAGAVDDVVQCFGRLDAVAGCAGVSGPFGLDISRVPPAEWQRVFDVNVTGQFHLVRSAVTHLRRVDAGAVVLIGSDSAFVAAPGMVPYCASKAAVVQLAKALAVDLAPDGIRVNAVCPSITDTPMARGDLGLSKGFAGQAYPVQSADDVARHVAYLVSPESHPINGTALVSDFGYLARSSFPA